MTWRKMKKGWWLHEPSGLEFLWSTVLRRWCILRHPEIRASSRRDALQKAREHGLV